MADIETQISLADAIDDALGSGDASTNGTANERRYQVGNAEVSGAEVDRWRKLRAIPEVGYSQKTGRL